MAVAVCTTYYVDQVQARQDPDLGADWYTGKHGSASGRIRWRDHDADEHVSYAPAREVYAAQVEGTVELTDEDGISHTLQYEGRGWWYETDAPHGLGSRLNALVVGRDCATNHTPWGSRIRWVIHERLRGHIRQEMFVADVFGVQAADDRFDLFVSHGVSEKVRQAYTVDPPASCEGLSWHPVRSLQEILKAWDLYDYKVDGIVGQLTIAGVDRWLREMAPQEARADLDVYLQSDRPYPLSYLPRDPAVYWWTRKLYCEAKEQR